MQQLTRVLKLCYDNDVNFERLHISHEVENRQIYIKLSGLPISNDVLYKIMNEGNLSNTYPIGSAIAGLRKSYNNLDKNWMELGGEFKTIVKSIPRGLES